MGDHFYVMSSTGTQQRKLAAILFTDWVDDMAPAARDVSPPAERQVRFHRRP